MLPRCRSEESADASPGGLFTVKRTQWTQGARRQLRAPWGRLSRRPSGREPEGRASLEASSSPTSSSVQQLIRDTPVSVPPKPTAIVWTYAGRSLAWFKCEVYTSTAGSIKMASEPVRFLFHRPLPYINPQAQRGLLNRALVTAGSSALTRRLSTTRLWRQTVWKIEPTLQRLSGGRLTTAVGLPTALLETRGARTGQWRRNGVIYFHDGDRVTIVASQAGYPGNPAWYYNLVANPDVRLGGEHFRARVVVDVAERARLWKLADGVFPAFEPYRQSAACQGRDIPIIQLTAC